MASWSPRLTFNFRIIGDKFLLIVKTDELVSSSNQFMKVDGLAIIFSNPEEIDKFLSKINVSDIQKFISKPQPENLFK